MLRRLLFPIFLVAVVALIGGAVLSLLASSPPYNYCIGHNGQYETGKKDPEGSLVVHNPLVNPTPTRLFFFCGGVFASDNGEGITALGTVLLFLVTAILGGIAYRQFTTSRAQLRAYILLDGGNVWDASGIGEATVAGKFELVNYEQRGFVTADLMIRNSGQTPARDVRHYGRIGVGSEASGIYYFTQGDEDRSGRSYASPIGPGTSISKRLWLGPFPMTEPFLSQLITGEKAIFVAGRITYYDAFGRFRETEYRAFYSGLWPPIPNGRLTFAVSGNRFT